MRGKNLTARFVETITTNQARTDVPDGAVRGLQLRVTDQGTKTWALRYTRQSDGRRRRFTLGTFPDLSLEEARTRALEELATVARGADPAGGVAIRKAAPTFREIAADWQTNHAASNRADRVRADDQSMLNGYVFPVIGDMKVEDIGRRELSAMLNGVRTAKDSRKGHVKPDKEPRKLTHRPNRVFELVRAILRWAHAQGIILADPTAGMKRPVKKEAPRERELSPIEIETFWRSVELLPVSPGLRIALKLALVTAQRIGEICGIAKAELLLDGPAPVWVIPRARTKNDEGHRVPLSPLAVSVIREALALQKPKLGHNGGTDIAGAKPESAWLFPARAKRDKSHGPIEANAAAVAMFRGRDKLGIEEFRVHDLRRTAATRMAEMGINPHTISLVLNHVSASKSTITSRVYVQYSFDREKREALDAWGARLEQIIAGKEGANVVALPTAAKQEPPVPRPTESAAR